MVRDNLKVPKTYRCTLNWKEMAQKVKSWSLGELRKGQIAMKYWMGYRVDDLLSVPGRGTQIQATKGGE